MTREVHDLFAKEWLKEFLVDLGEVNTDRQVSRHVRAIDLFFHPNLDRLEALKPLGLLGRMLSKPCPIEFFRNAVPRLEITHCRGKVLDLRWEIEQRATRKKQPLRHRDLPFLWILSPTLSDTMKRKRCVVTRRNWGPGIYFLPEEDYTAIVAIHELPITTDTLWIRLLGKGKVQAQAVAELMELPVDHPYRETTIAQLSILRVNLEIRQNKTKDLREVIMNLSPAYEQWFAKTIDQGKQEGEQIGIVKEKYGVARRLLSKNMPLAEIAEVTDLTIAQLQALQAEEP